MAALLSAVVFLTPSRPPSTAPLARAQSARTVVPSSPASGPPWRYGRADARFTVIEYADLECPYCKAYFPVLGQWIDANPDVNWEWRHLPLSMHEPAASLEARLVECVGQTQGSEAFWKALSWVYAHTRGDGQGLPRGLRYPGLTSAVQQCLDGDQVVQAIRKQAAGAEHDRIAATPTLRLEDHASGRTLLLPGPIEGDALLSAIDLLAGSAEIHAATHDLATSLRDDVPHP